MPAHTDPISLHLIERLPIVSISFTLYFYFTPSLYRRKKAKAKAGRKSKASSKTHVKATSSQKSKASKEARSKAGSKASSKDGSKASEKCE